jgi:hypothetical protein
MSHKRKEFKQFRALKVTFHQFLKNLPFNIEGSQHLIPSSKPQKMYGSC